MSDNRMPWELREETKLLSQEILELRAATRLLEKEALSFKLQIRRLRAGLKGCIELAKDGWSYAGPYGCDIGQIKGFESLLEDTDGS